jgi:tRNA A37 threonylcarbamoyladenosine biosynthesis protein TsaE
VDAICFVEWPEAASDALPPVRVAVRLSHMDRERRTIEVESDDGQLLAGVAGDADARV